MHRANPILVEVTRGERVESWHRGAVAVVDVTGSVVRSVGDVDRPVFPRSTLKPLQALPLLASGAADRFSLSAAEITLACGSHMGDPSHVAAAASLLAKAGADPGQLECGAHWPLGEQAARDLAASGDTPSSLHNNCSGKHAGFLCLARHRGHPSAGYVVFEHPVMREVAEAIAAATGATVTATTCGIDGCSIPAPALPLVALARGFARLATGDGLPSALSAAAARIRESWIEQPKMIAGEGCFDTLLAAAAAGAVLTKSGAEGMAAAVLPRLGLGVAVKMDDGAGRAAEAALAAVIAGLLNVSEGPLSQLLTSRSRRPLLNWRGTTVGEVRAVLTAVPPAA